MKARTGRFWKIRSFTCRSICSRSSEVSACGCVKSKRSLSGRTAEPAALRVERRLLQLRLEPAVAEVLVGEDRGEDVRLLIADELAADVAGDPYVDFLDGTAGALPLLVHQPVEAVDVHDETAFACKLLGQLDGEAVRVVQAESVVASYRSNVPTRDFLEELEPAGKRLGEALLLGGKHRANLVRPLAELRIRLARLLDHDVGQPREERRREPDPPGLLHRTPHDPAHHVAPAFIRGGNPVGR